MAVNFKSVLECRVLRFECARVHCVRRAKCKIGPAYFPIVERRFRVKCLDCQHFSAMRIYVLGDWSVEDAYFCCGRCR